MANLNYGLGFSADSINWGAPSTPLGFSGVAPAASPHPLVPMPNVDMSMGGTAAGLETFSSQGARPGMTYGEPLQVPTGGAASMLPPTAAGAVDESGFGWNLDTMNTVMGGLGMLGKLWAGIQSNRIAQDSLDFQKKAFKENLANQRQSYNTAISDRAHARYTQMGTPGRADDYIRENSL